jgi:hypothetical protein
MLLLAGYVAVIFAVNAVRGWAPRGIPAPRRPVQSGSAAPAGTAPPAGAAPIAGAGAGERERDG